MRLCKTVIITLNRRGKELKRPTMNKSYMETYQMAASLLISGQLDIIEIIQCVREMSRIGRLTLNRNMQIIRQGVNKTLNNR